MKQGWRWYGDRDAVSLKEIRQAGVTDIVAALYERKPGEVWPVAEIRARQFLAALKTYAGIDDATLRTNLYAFLNEISPTLDRFGVDLCIHPDDPPHPIFGLPRVFSTAADIRQMVRTCSSKHVGLTLCTGSLGGSLANDEVAIFKEFAKRIFFCHFRNLEYEEPGVFHESRCHLVGKTNLPALMLALLREEKRRGAGIVVRPDHGRLMEIDRGRRCYCGYSYGGRLVGLAELRGLELGLKYLHNL